MVKATEQQVARIVDLYRGGLTGYEIAVELGEKIGRVYAVLRERLPKDELTAVRRQRHQVTPLHLARRVAARWLDAIPMLRRGARVRLMTLERRLAFAEQIEQFLARSQLRTSDPAFLCVALAFAEVRPSTFVVELVSPQLCEVADARLWTRQDLEDICSAVADGCPPSNVRVACTVSKGEKFDALEAEVALLAMS